MKKQEARDLIKAKKIEEFLNKDRAYYNSSSLMVSNVLQFPLFKSSKKIALFASKKVSFEIHTDALITQSIKVGKEVFLPRCIIATHDLEYVKIHDLEQDVEIGAYSIREPKQSIEIQDQKEVFKHFDLIFVPGVAFDTHGNRLGFGSGYYDNFIKSVRKIRYDIPVIALAFDFQLLENEIPHNAKDEKVDYIITPTIIHHCDF